MPEKEAAAAEETFQHDADFDDRLIEALDRQYRKYEPYRVLCEQQGVGPNDLKAMVEQGDLHAITAVPAEWFKLRQSNGIYRKLADFDKGGGWMVSSATTGDPSYVWRTEADKTIVIDSFSRVYRSIPKTVCLTFSPASDFLEKVGKRFIIDEHPASVYGLMPTISAEIVFDPIAFLARLDVPRTIFNSIRSMGKGRPVLNLDRRRLMRELDRAERDGSKVILASSVLLLYPAVQSLPKNYDLGRNVLFLTGGGGWDGKKGALMGKLIDKRTFVEDMCRKFNIPEEVVATNFWDTYGTAENGKAQPGPFSLEFGDYIYEVGPDVKLYAVDPATGPVKSGEKGFPKFISPYGIEGFAGACVQQQDIIEVVSAFDDGSVRQFSHIHRASCAGCAIDVAEGVRMS